MPETISHIDRLWVDADAIQQTNYYLQQGAIRTDATRYSNTVRYLVNNAADEETALAYAQDEVPAAYRGYPLTGLNVEERRSDNIWVVSAVYGNKEVVRTNEDRETHEETISFSTAGGTQLLRAGLAVTTSGGTYNPGILLNPDGDGNPQGQEITAPALGLNITKWYKPAEVTLALINSFYGATGTVNNAEWRGFPAGAVLFAGCDGNRGGDDTDDWWQISFKFQIRSSQTVTLPVWAGSGEATADTAVTVKGWEYLNIRTVRIGTTASKSAIAGYSVVKLYPESTFAF